MSEITNIETLVRYLIEDFSNTMIPGDVFTYNTDNVFTLSESNVILVTEVFQNGTELGSGDWSYDSSTNKVTVSASLTAGDSIEIQYTYYPNYSSTEIASYIRAAVVHISVNNYYTFEVDSNDNIFPILDANQRNLISFVAATLIKPDNKTYRLPDMSITVSKSLPTVDLVRKAVTLFKRNSHGIFEL